MATTATTKQIATITKLLTHRDHTDTGKTITVGEARFRTTADKIATISKAVASRMIDALLQAPEVATPKAPARPHFTQKAGQWVIAHPEADWSMGDIVEVRTAGGETRRVKLNGKLEIAVAGSQRAAEYDSLDAWAFVTRFEEPATEGEAVEGVEVEPAAETVEPTPAPKLRATGWSRYRRGYRDACPTCGEEEMWHYGVCDECGHRERGADPAAERQAQRDAEDKFFARQAAKKQAEREAQAARDREFRARQAEKATAPADRLDAIVAELKPVETKINELMFTPDGSLRDWGDDVQAEIDVLRGRADGLIREACALTRQSPVT